MTRLDPETYLTHLAADSARFRAVLASCDPDARVPACPDWSAADLLHHLTGVQAHWADAVEVRPAAPDEVELARSASYAGMLAAYDAASARLLDQLASVDPAEEAWNWSDDHTVGFLQRRQAHEAAIHRIDAEQAAGTPAPLDPLLAADGVDEVLAVIFGGSPAWGTFTASGQHMRVDLTDVDQSVWVALGQFTGMDPESGRFYDEPDLSVVDDPGLEPDAVVDGLAADLDQWLWKRGDDAGVHVTGDRDACDRFRLVVDQPID